MFGISHVSKSAMFVNYVSMICIFTTISISFFKFFSLFSGWNLFASLSIGMVAGLFVGFIVSAVQDRGAQNMFTRFRSSPEAQERFKKNCERSSFACFLSIFFGMAFLAFLAGAWGTNVLPTRVAPLVALLGMMLSWLYSAALYTCNLYFFERREQARVSREEQAEAEIAAQLEQAQKANREFRRGMVLADREAQQRARFTAEDMQTLKADGLFPVSLLPPAARMTVGSFTGALPSMLHQKPGKHAGRFAARQDEQTQRASRMYGKTQRARENREAERSALQEAIASREAEELKDLQQRHKEELRLKLADFQEETYQQMPEELRDLKKQDLEKGTNALHASVEYQNYTRQRSVLRRHLAEQRKEATAQALQLLEETQRETREQALAEMDARHAEEKAKLDGQLKAERAEIRHWEAYLLWKEQETKLKEIYERREKEGKQQEASFIASPQLEAAVVNDREQDEEKQANDPTSWKYDPSKQPLLAHR